MFKTHKPGTRVSVRAPYIGGLLGLSQQVPDGYEGEWYVIRACERDGDHLLAKHPDDDTGEVWINVSRLEPAP